MATKQLARDVYVKRNAEHFRRGLSFAEVVAELGASEKARILEAIRSGQANKIGKIVLRASVVAGRKAAAVAADGILVDDVISLEELDGFL